MIQRYFLEYHKIDDHVTKKEKGRRFTPVKERAANPMNLVYILG